jgi:hypothetical protein
MRRKSKTHPFVRQQRTKEWGTRKSEGEEKIAGKMPAPRKPPEPVEASPRQNLSVTTSQLTLFTL